VSRRTRRSPYLLVAVDFGYTLLASLIIFGGLGWWLDGRANTTPLFLTAGILLGLAVAFNGLLRRLRVIERAEKAERDRDEQPPTQSQP
jgi:F0F1-type ATP synthase assembly protein I